MACCCMEVSRVAAVRVVEVVWLAGHSAPDRHDEPAGIHHQGAQGACGRSANRQLYRVVLK
jgi:hypothetical protein